MPAPTSLDQTSDYYRLAYAIGAFARDHEGVLTAGCLGRCCDLPTHALALHLRHVAVELSRHPVASDVIATIDPAGLPEQPTVERQSEYWVGYYHGRALRWHRG